MDVFLSPLAITKLKDLVDYLEMAWGQKVKQRFLQRFEAKIEQLKQHPESCPKSKVYKGIYKCVLSKQTSFFYRINTELKAIEIITIFDNRQDPDTISLTDK
jgi:plasmid stabilization system protein ParE